MPFCTTCGANVNGTFCAQCGTPVGAAGTTPPQPAQQPAMPPPYTGQPYAAPPPGMTPMPAPRKTSPLVWVLVIILGIFFVGFASCAAFGLYVAHKVKQA